MNPLTYIKAVLAGLFLFLIVFFAEPDVVDGLTPLLEALIISIAGGGTVFAVPNKRTKHGNISKP